MDAKTPKRKPPGAHPAPEGEPARTVERELGRLQKHLDLLKVQVRQAQQLSSLGTAATMIAHEVNNLLTPILSYARAALDSDDAQLQRKALQVTLKNVELLIEMTERLLKLGAAKPARRARVCVRTVAQEAAASLCRDLSKDGIRFTVEVEESVTVWADPLQLQQVLFNLFLNAREAMAGSHGGRLKVKATRQADDVVITVGNTGEVIAPELLPHIFDPFQSSKPTGRDDRARCSGLGLALCRDLIEENDGTITASSDPNTGTTFTITLPFKEPGGDAP